MTGTVVGERYRLDELIGRGGMATVWRATDMVLERPVAVKRLHAGLLADEELSERFRREALLVARLSHPNLVHLLDRGEDADGPYLVFELVEGENLKSRLRREGALPPVEAARICAQVGRALAYAHGQGVVHRDIKAQNVLLTPDGQAKLADFGIARLIEAEGQPGLTRTDMLVGSADYLAPEQADGGPLDARTDVYSLGIVLYECLTGSLPFTGEGFVAVAMKHCSVPLPDPRLAAPQVPAWLAACAMRAAAKDPGRRHPDAAAMVAALEGGERAAQAEDPGAGGTAVLPALGDGGDGDDAATGRAARPRRRRALIGLAVALVIAAAAAAGVILADPAGDGGAPAAEPVALTISAVRDYDPEGDDGEEMPDLRGFAIDGDPSTAWRTERYATEDFGNLKEGVGLLVGLSAPAVPTEIEISSPTPGVRFEVRGPDEGGSRAVLGRGVLGEGPQTIALSGDAPVRAVLIWLTALVPDDSGHYWAGIGQVRVRGVPNQT